uniref:NtA domain-containing protein n=1 Tax=Romanomermis culicivorax TaxID=13658 RepID=A0A915IYV7_ROMCU
MLFNIFIFYFFDYVQSTSKECSLLNYNYTNYGRHWDFLEEYRQNYYDPLFEETGQHCFDFDRNLTELERAAPIILTGTVEKLVKSKNGQNFGRLQNEVFTGLIRVRRVLKGRFLMFRDIYNRDLIGVDGFFDWNICDSRIEEKDTKIFFLTKLESGSKNTFADVLKNNFRLNSSLLRISVKNLKLIGQIIKNRKMIKFCEIERRPCEAMLCSYGAKCFMNATSRHPYCACDYSCENYIELPICGSDN